MLKLYTAFIGDNNLHNVVRLDIVAEHNALDSDIRAAINTSYPNTPIIDMTSELLYSKGYCVAEKFVGTSKKEKS